MSNKVLVVDDDDNIRLIAQISLEDDFEVVTASSGKEALEVAAEEQPQVILLDMMMPHMDGQATFTKLREQEKTAHIPVIFITAKVQAEEVESYSRLGALGVIMKPFDPMTLPEQVKNLIARISTI